VLSPNHLSGIPSDISQVVLKSANKSDSNLAREIHHHRQFIHPHIARLYEVIVTENLVWLALEYCSGSYPLFLPVPSLR
jgi:serine/threonine protein kinase